jgi:hypothetical protein
MLKVLLLRQISRATKAHHLVFLCSHCSAVQRKRHIRKMRISNCRLGIRPLQNTLGPIGSGVGMESETNWRQKASSSTFSILRTYKQILSEAFGKRRLPGVAFAARWI